MKSYIQLTKLADTYYDFWTSDGIDSFHADPENVSAWLKNDDIRTDADDSLDDLTDDEIDTIADMIADMVADKMKAYYILRDLDGYGSEYPVCVTRAEADDLMREWYAMDDNAPEFDDVWREADANDIAEYGTGDE